MDKMICVTKYYGTRKKKTLTISFEEIQFLSSKILVTYYSVEMPSPNMQEKI